MKRLALSLFFVLAGCDTNVAVDPEGHRCDAANACPSGYLCTDGSCRRGTTVDPTCEGVSCNDVPASSCVNNTVLRSFSGRCAAGQCQYDSLDTSCATSCANGACVDACAGISCVTPPSTACVDVNTLRTFAMTGTCGNGTCTYVQTDTACPNGCENAVCKGVDLCDAMNVTCTTPPDAVCVNGARRVFTTPGSCEPGTGQCSYQQTDTPCANGCAAGACLTPSLTFTQTGPRVHFAINGIDVAPGSSGNSALAVGNGGKLAKWDGVQWTELTTQSTADLNAVSFVTGTLAYVVGSASTVYTVRATTNAVTPVSLLGSSNTTLRFVSGRTDDVLLADSTGGWWRLRAGAWTNGSLPGSNGPWNVRGVYLDEAQRERVVGSCRVQNMQQRCVAYRNLGGTPTSFRVDSEGGSPLSAVGGGFDVPSNFSSEALLGLDSNGLRTHNATSFFGAETPSPTLSGTGVVGITAQAVSTNRNVYVLTSSAPPTGSMNGEGHLYRLESSFIGGVSSIEALTTYFGEEKLSANDANGVLVAEVRRNDRVNNIFRRGPITNEALDVGEDFIGASIDTAGGLVLATAFGDVIVRATGSNTFDFRRPTFQMATRGFEARNGTGVLLAGTLGSGAIGVLVRNTGTTFTQLAMAMGTPFNAVCRVSDTEGWAVGVGGVIYRVTAMAATAVTSPTTKELVAIDCAAGSAIAVGADGTVVRLENGAWVTVAFPNANERLSMVQLVTGGAYVASDGVFTKLTTSGWATLPSQPGLKRLVARSPQEVYGAFVTNGSTAIRRFDGAAWSSDVATVSGSLGGGVQQGSRVVWGGTLGAIVEGG